MAHIYPGLSRTFSEFLLVPNLTTKECVPSRVSLETPLVKHRASEKPALALNLPMVSAVMQAVSNTRVAIELAKCGGLSFIYHSQKIEAQARMVRAVKEFRAGFSKSDSNVLPTTTLAEATDLAQRTGHNNIAVTSDGTGHGILLGLLTRKDLPFDQLAEQSSSVSKFMTPVGQLVVGNPSTTLDQARRLIWERKIDCLPIVDGDGRLVSLVFRRDFLSLQESPHEVLDGDKRLLVGAGINTHDYRERIPAMLDAGADLLVLDSSDGFSEYQRDAIQFAKSGEFGRPVYIGGGNIVDREGFRYLAESGADFVKVGIGGGSICITREQKGIGRGSADALIEVAAARDEWLAETGEYVPLCVDGGIVLDYQMVIAYALGADFIMMGRYFARFDESPGEKIRVGNRHMKEYWAEGSNRAANWARYDLGDGNKLKFEEGVNGLVPYAGGLRSNVGLTRAKIVSTMCNCGALSLAELRRKARLVVLSELSFADNTAQVDRVHSDDRSLD